METSLNNYMSDYKKQFNSFGQLLTKSGFGFKKHQFEGVQWCVKNELRGTGTSVNNVVTGTSVNGGVIADEMGLGKTILMIGTMYANFVNKTIIVVPPILIDQWYNEIYKCSGHKALIYYGVNKKKIGLVELSKACIVITSYNTLLPLKSKKTKSPLVNHLFGIKWDRAIFDEAHHLRNMKTTRFEYCKKIDARIRWLVSGTPIQNRRSDFYSLCNILETRSMLKSATRQLHRVRVKQV
jgi:SNF2 family DNA or RNA helicase